MDSQLLVSQSVTSKALHRKALCYSQDESMYYESLYYVLLLTRLLHNNKKSDHWLL